MYVFHVFYKVQMVPNHVKHHNDQQEGTWLSLHIEKLHEQLETIS